MQLLNPQLDFETLIARYQRDRYVVIENFLAAASAERLFQALISDLPWEFWRRDSQGTEVVVPERWKAVPDAEREGWVPAPPQSVDHFHFAYERVTPSMQSLRTEVQILGASVKALNSKAYLACMKLLGGDRRVSSVDGAVSRYQAGHYLSPHTDANKDQERIAAHVLTLTRDWQRPWGGGLTLCTESGEALATIRPSFNSLVLFEGPPAMAPGKCSRPQYFHRSSARK